MNSVDRTSQATRLQGLTVLIVEDHDDSREMLREHLTCCGALCAEAASGNEAFRTFVEQHPAILLSDMRMPDGDGFELIHRIRELPPDEGGLVPAIAISGEANAEQAMMAGYHVLVPKPFDPDEMVCVLEEFVRAGTDIPSRRTSWALSSPSPGTVVIALSGYVRPADMRAAAAVLLRKLEEQPCEVILDFTRLTGFSLAVASVAEKALWAERQAIRLVRVVGGPIWARSVATAACRVLGLGCSVESSETPA
jgi:CheY-like chemotaxis protein